MQNQKKQEQVFNDCHDMNSLETEIQNETITKNGQSLMVIMKKQCMI